jgi:hypothetical protein
LSAKLCQNGAIQTLVIVKASGIHNNKLDHSVHVEIRQQHHSWNKSVVGVWALAAQRQRKQKRPEERS